MFDFTDQTFTTETRAFPELMRFSDETRAKMSARSGERVAALMQTVPGRRRRLT